MELRIIIVYYLFMFLAPMLAASIVLAQPLRVECIGDSITVGGGPGTQGGGYRYFLKQRLGDAIDFVGCSEEYPGPLTDREHDGHGGWTTRDLIDGKSGLGCAADWVAECSPDVVLLMIGRNDPWPWTETLDQYRELAAAIFGSAPQVTLVWSNVLLPADQGQGETVHCEIQDLSLIHI